MDALSKLLRDEIARRTREAVQAAEARRTAAATSAPASGRAARRRAGAPAERPPRTAAAPGPLVERAARLADGARAGDDLLAPVTLADPAFPTTILDVPVEPPAPLLAAFATQNGLLAAIVLAEALASPLALREQPFAEPMR